MKRQTYQPREKTPQSTLAEVYEQQVFTMNEMRAIFDHLNTNKKFQDLVMTANRPVTERCTLVNPPSPTFEVSSQATLNLRFKNQSDNLSAGYKVVHLNPNPNINFGTRVIEEEWRSQEEKEVTLTTSMPDSPMLKQDLIFGVFSIFGTQHGPTFTVPVSVALKSHDEESWPFRQV